LKFDNTSFSTLNFSKFVNVPKFVKCDSFLKKFITAEFSFCRSSIHMSTTLASIVNHFTTL